MTYATTTETNHNLLTVPATMFANQIDRFMRRVQWHIGCPVELVDGYRVDADRASWTAADHAARIDAENLILDLIIDRPWARPYTAGLKEKVDLVIEAIQNEADSWRERHNAAPLPGEPEAAAIANAYAYIDCASFEMTVKEFRLIVQTLTGVRA